MANCSAAVCAVTWCVCLLQGTRSESTYAHNRYVECSYTSPGTDATTCIPDAHPADVCPGSGVPCPHCGKSACPCPSVSLAAGAFVSLADASNDYFGNTKASSSVSSSASFESFRSTLLLLDSSDNQERRGLAFRRLTKLTQPWVTENPCVISIYLCIYIDNCVLLYIDHTARIIESRTLDNAMHNMR